MGKNFLQRQEEERKRWIRAARVNEQVFCCDIIQITLGRLGYGEKRLAEFEKTFSAAYIEYDELRESDGKEDRENTYYKACIDRELARYAGRRFVPYDKRHGL